MWALGCLSLLAAEPKREEPTAAWLAADLWQDERRGGAAARRAAWEEACSDGDAFACRWRAWQSSAAPHHPRLVEVFQPLCKDEARACLGLAWGLGQVRPGVYSPAAADPAGALRVLDSACVRGLERACLEADRARLAGLAQDLDPAPLTTRLDARCREEGGLSCLAAGDGWLAQGDATRAVAAWKRGAATGEPASWLRLADRGAAKDGAQQACDAGLLVGCGRLARARGEASGLEQACQGGDGASCLALADRVGDPEARLGWAEQGCEQAEPAACALASKLLLERAASGTDRPGDVLRAERLAATACQLGDGATCLQRGLEDRHGGLPWIERACKLGDSEGCEQLLAIDLANGEGERVLARVRPACQAGDARSCLYAASALWTRGPEGYAEAVDCWDQACAAGSGLGCGLAARALELGVDRQRSLEASFARYRSSCDRGLGYACTELGHTEVRANAGLNPAAEALYRQACQAGDSGGCAALARARDAAEAPFEERRSLWTQACLGEEAAGSACANLAVLLGDNGSLDLVAPAQEARARACRLGDVSSCRPEARLTRWPTPQPGGPWIDTERAACHLRDDIGCLSGFVQALFGGSPSADLVRRYPHVAEPACSLDPSLCRLLAMVEEDPAAAYRRYEEACLSGNDRPSCVAAARLVDQGVVTPPDPHRPLTLAVAGCSPAAEDRPGCYGLYGWLERWPGSPSLVTSGEAALCLSVAPSRCATAARRIIDGFGGDLSPDDAYQLALHGCRSPEGTGCDWLRKAALAARQGVGEPIVRQAGAEEEGDETWQYEGDGGSTEHQEGGHPH